MPEKYEHLKFLVERFDHYYDTINSKGNAMLVINTFSIGGVAAFYTALQQDVEWTTSLKCWGCLLCILWVLSLIFTSWALMPYRNSASNSLIFFGGIAKQSESGFLQRVTAQQDDALLEDMQLQVYYLAQGLALKFERLRRATYLLFASYGVLLVVFIILLTNLK